MRILTLSYRGEGRIEVPKGIKSLTFPPGWFLGLEPPKDFLDVYKTLVGLKDRFDERSVLLEHPDGWEPYRGGIAHYSKRDNPEIKPKISIEHVESRFSAEADDIGRPWVPRLLLINEHGQYGQTHLDDINRLVGLWGYVVSEVRASTQDETRETSQGVYAVRKGGWVNAEKSAIRNERVVTIYVGSNMFDSDIQPFVDGISVKIDRDALLGTLPKFE